MMVKNEERKFTLEQLDQADHDGAGFCLECGHMQHGCKPETRQDTCNNCGEDLVFGAMELLIMGYVK